MAEYTFRCGICGETAQASSPDPELWSQMIVAHGLTHDRDWREAADVATVAQVTQEAEGELMALLGEANRRGLLDEPRPAVRRGPCVCESSGVCSLCQGPGGGR